MTVEPGGNTWGKRKRRGGNTWGKENAGEENVCTCTPPHIPFEKGKLKEHQLYLSHRTHKHGTHVHIRITMCHTCNFDGAVGWSGEKEEGVGVSHALLQHHISAQEREATAGTSNMIPREAAPVARIGGCL